MDTALDVQRLYQQAKDRGNAAFAIKAYRSAAAYYEAAASLAPSLVVETRLLKCAWFAHVVAAGFRSKLDL